MAATGDENLRRGADIIFRRRQSGSAKEGSRSVLVQNVELSRAGRLHTQVGRDMNRNVKTPKIVHFGGSFLISIDLAENLL